VISTRASRSAFLCGLCALCGESFLRGAAVLLGLMFMPGCGGGSSTTTTTSTPTPVANTVSVAVNAGPANNAVNFAYVSVQVCSPGSTTNCITIPDVQVDTGSTGLRILASAPGVSSLLPSLTPVTGSGTPVYECVQEGDGNYLWGQVEQANVSMAGEIAASLPIQIISAPETGIAPPSGCTQGGGNNLDTSTLLQANGILGISTAPQDCGGPCAGTSVANYYWLCTSSGCTNASVPTATQVSNPVVFFNSDNNGVMLTMNSVGASGAASGSGTLTFGIGTQSDNALSSSVKAYALSGNSINGQLFYSISATYNGLTYPALIDSGETVLFFLDPNTLSGAGISGCPQPNSSLYCTSSPSTVVSLPFTAKDASGDSGTVTLSMGNGTTLWNSSVLNGGSNTAFSNLAGGYSLGVNDYVNLGLPFFYGRTVYVGIAGQVPPTGVPNADTALGYWAF
jgi:hypothetical protein